MPRSTAETNGVTGGKYSAISRESVELNQGPLRCFRDNRIFCVEILCTSPRERFLWSDKLRNITVIVGYVFS
jgi:hypothetical protein